MPARRSKISESRAFIQKSSLPSSTRTLVGADGLSARCLMSWSTVWPVGERNLTSTSRENVLTAAWMSKAEIRLLRRSERVLEVDLTGTGFRLMMSRDRWSSRTTHDPVMHGSRCGLSWHRSSSGRAPDMKYCSSDVSSGGVRLSCMRVSRDDRSRSSPLSSSRVGDRGRCKWCHIARAWRADARKLLDDLVLWSGVQAAVGQVITSDSNV